MAILCDPRDCAPPFHGPRKVMLQPVVLDAKGHLGRVHHSIGTSIPESSLDDDVQGTGDHLLRKATPNLRLQRIIASAEDRSSDVQNSDTQHPDN